MLGSSLDLNITPSPDFDCDSMDKLICAAPDSFLDTDMYTIAGDLAVHPLYVFQASQKHLHLSPPESDDIATLTLAFSPTIK